MPLPALWTTTLFSLLLAALVAIQYPEISLIRDVCAGWSWRPPADVEQGVDVNTWNIFYHMGGNSPWIPRLTDLPSDIPGGCRVDQVHLLSRHAERYPTYRAGVRMLELHRRLMQPNLTYTGPLEFVSRWDFFLVYPTSQLDALISTGPYAGTLGAFSNGVRFRTRYSHLVRQAIEQDQTTFWASGSSRVEATARYFAAGLYGLEWPSFAKLSVISEDSSLAGDTLTPGTTCEAYRRDTIHGHDGGYSKLTTWQNTYIPPIIARLAVFAPNITFTVADTYTLQEICGFETLATGSSAWCSVFTHSEWLDFEYARDLLHFYRAGPGNPYAGAMGHLWLSATLGLLQAGPSVGPLFASFVHDGDIVPLLTTLDLLPQLRHLSPHHRMDNRTWRTSDVVPMNGHVVLERLTCAMEQRCWSNEPFYPNHVYCTPDDHEETFVRVLVNGAVMPLDGCADGPGNSCSLPDFERRVKRRGWDVGSFREVCGLREGQAEGITFLKQKPYRPP